MEIWILVLLILLSGFFAMSEMSIGASRASLLAQMAATGNEGARIAAELRAFSGTCLAISRMIWRRWWICFCRAMWLLARLAY